MTSTVRMGRINTSTLMNLLCEPKLYFLIFEKKMRKKFVQVYLDFQIGTAAAGRVVFEVFTDITPKTAENFRGLCTGIQLSSLSVQVNTVTSAWARRPRNCIISTPPSIA